MLITLLFLCLMISTFCVQESSGHELHIIAPDEDANEIGKGSNEGNELEDGSKELENEGDFFLTYSDTYMLFLIQ